VSTTPIGTSEAARILGKTQAQVRDMIQRGELKPIQKVGGRWLLDSAQVEAKAKQSMDWVRT
jgi:excisionase family DNA binding protein